MRFLPSLQRIFSGGYHFLRGRNPLHPALLKGRLKPLTFRPFAPEDLPKCLELYALNEPGRFPQGVIDQYEQALNDQTSCFLVAEEEGRIVASGGLSCWTREDFVVLCFGLVRPGYQGRGVGTTLLLARLALLDLHRRDHHVFIFAVEKSFGFYQRFGFSRFTSWQDARGQAHPAGHLHFASFEIRRCRRILQANGIVIPQNEIKIPFRKAKTSS